MVLCRHGYCQKAGKSLPGRLIVYPFLSGAVYHVKGRVRALDENQSSYVASGWLECNLGPEGPRVQYT